MLIGLRKTIKRSSTAFITHAHLAQWTLVLLGVSNFFFLSFFLSFFFFFFFFIAVTGYMFRVDVVLFCQILYYQKVFLIVVEQQGPFKVSKSKNHYH